MRESLKEYCVRYDRRELLVQWHPDKNGNLTGDIASRAQLRMLEDFVMKTLGEIVDEIASGEVSPNPYTRGNSHNACAFCPFGAVCHKAEVEGRRNRESVSAAEFWEEIQERSGTKCH